MRARKALDPRGSTDLEQDDGVGKLELGPSAVPPSSPHEGDNEQG